jgi:branched-chain amino acid transport system permease protein
VTARTVEGTAQGGLDRAGLAARVAAAVGLVVVVFASPVVVGDVWAGRIALMAIYAIIGLSFNVITGYAGQISLGHQAFVGIGAFTAAYVFGHIAGFIVGFVAAGLMGAALAFALGLVSLRVKGLYFALVTLAFGLMAYTTIFEWRPFTGAGAGTVDPRPTGFDSNQAYAYLSLLFLAFFLYVDWRMSKSKPGRAVVAVRNNETVAASLGINVKAYKLLAFAVGGFLAGVAGALFASYIGTAYATSFGFPDPALVWLVMAVVGGLGSRAGIVVGSAFFALLSPTAQWLSPHPIALPAWLHFIGVRSLTLATTIGPLVGAILLLLTVTLYPGGIGQQLLPIRRWMAGGPFRTPRRATLEEVEPDAVEPVAPAVPAPRTARTPTPSPAPPPAPEPTQEVSVRGTPETNGSEAPEGQPQSRRSSLFGFRRRKERTP